jgi:hypothetical protein
MIDDHNPVPFGQKSDGFRESDPFLLHDKGKDIPADSAAKTVKHLFVRTDGKRGGFFSMKGTQSDKVPARFFQHDRIGNDLQDIGAMFDFRYFFRRDGVRQEQASKIF